MGDAAASQGLLHRIDAADVVENITGDFDLIVDGVGGARCSALLSNTSPRVASSSTIPTQSDDKTVTFHVARFDRAKGARIYTLNLFDKLASHASAASDLARLCKLMADGRLDGQIELEGSWREPSRSLDAPLEQSAAG